MLFDNWCIFGKHLQTLKMMELKKGWERDASERAQFKIKIIIGVFPV